MDRVEFEYARQSEAENLTFKLKQQALEKQRLQQQQEMEMRKQRQQ